MLSGGTIADIYRRAKGLLDSPGIDKTSLQNAVDVARWIQYIPIMSRTVYGSTLLEWSFGRSYLSMDFIPHSIRIVSFSGDNTAAIFEGIQHFERQIPIDILGLLVSQFAASAQLPPITLRPWDKFGGIKIEDIDIEEVNRLEAAGNAARVQAFFDQQKEEAEKNDSVTLPKETEDEKIETESSEEITLSSGNETT